MNKNGFALSGMLYTIFAIFVLLIVGLLTMFNSRKTILDKLKKKVLDETSNINEIYNLKPLKNTTQKYYDIVIPKTGYYQIEVVSSKIKSSSSLVYGSTFTGKIYLESGKRLRGEVGSYVEVTPSTLTKNPGNYFNQATTGIYYINEINKETNLINVSSFTSGYEATPYNNVTFENIKFSGNNNTLNEGKIVLTYIPEVRQNENMNKVKYIKDCISGSNIDNNNYFSEIKAIVGGENKIISSNIKGDINLLEAYKLTDNNTTTRVMANKKDTNNTSCIIAELDNLYNLDKIEVYHNTDNRKYSLRSLSVSSDGTNYKLIDNYEKEETARGIVINANEIKEVKKVGNVYASVKKISDGTVWLRIYHHNNLSGTILWQAISQVLMNGGYDTAFKKSILYNISSYMINGKYEFMLEYPIEYRGTYLRWSQTSNFTTDISITGFRLINNNMPGISLALFNGLKKNNASSSLSYSDSTFYNIGAFSVWNGGVAGAYTNKASTKSTDLWVRIE